MLFEYDDAVTRITYGYDTVIDCYRDGSCRHHIKKVQVPLLCLNSLDDPLAVAKCIPYDKLRYVQPGSTRSSHGSWWCRANPHVILATTRSGGHLGWFTGLRRVRQWCVQPISEFCTAVLQVLCMPSRHPAVSDQRGRGMTRSTDDQKTT
jgi:uncharacterized protein